MLLAVCLVWWTICSSQPLLAAGPNTDKLSDRVNRFVQTKERQMETARKKLLKDIDAVQREIKQSEPGSRRQAAALAEDQERIERDSSLRKELPSCDELLESRDCLRRGE